MRDSDYYIPALALALAFAAKLPAMRRGWRDPLVRSVLFLLLSASVCFVLAAPSTILAVNRITGVRNVSAPLVYSVMAAFSCACLVLVVNWRGGPGERVRRSSHRWITAYTAVILAQPVLFALGEAPVEQLRDFDTYYANTPFVREMIVVYLVAHVVAAAVTWAMCLRWARAVAHWLRIGLVVLVVGLTFNLSFGLAKLTAVVARWTGRDWDALSTEVAPPAAAVGGLIITVGFLLPLLGPRFSALRHAWLTYAHLGVLWRRLRPAARGARAPLPRAPWWAPAELRLTVRETAIHDELLRLQPYLDDRVRRRAYERARTAAGRVPQWHAQLVGVAVMVVTAVAVRADGRAPTEDEDPARRGADALTAALAPGRGRLVRLALALRSPLFADAVRREADRSAPGGATVPGAGVPARPPPPRTASGAATPPPGPASRTLHTARPDPAGRLPDRDVSRRTVSDVTHITSLGDDRRELRRARTAS